MARTAWDTQMDGLLRPECAVMAAHRDYIDFIDEFGGSGLYE